MTTRGFVGVSRVSWKWGDGQRRSRPIWVVSKFDLVVGFLIKRTLLSYDERPPDLN